MSVSVEEIRDYLEGYDNQGYIVSVESSYRENKVYLVIHDPINGKRIEKHKIQPFIWMKSLDISNLYKGDRKIIKQKMKEYGIKFVPLSTTDEQGNVVDRL